MVECADEDGVHVRLDVAPPVRPHRAGALGEVNLLVRVRIVEGVLVRVVAAVAMKGYSGECALSALHL